ncbi:glycosyltransferase family 4 protein [Cohnella luojiensis]|uniref:Glycosyltransferase family 1 protein n=1 Tax=Cohnella luojiensis TaxID=652876 RepID=A0A4Y8M4M7_9BACL|nr:glycosyltransferase family 4 protein [Cohnella luojiensis]TFE27275.1 glycosyltransferase family 1 protein [Cohnella luojiensis]
MKVAYYNHTSVVSGAEISLLLTVKNMTMVEPVIFSPEGELTDRAREAGLQVVPIKGYRARLSKNPLRLLVDMIGMLGEGLRLARLIRIHSVDLIHANSMRAGIMAALFGWLHRRPMIWHVRDNLPKGLIGNGIDRLARLTAQGIIGISCSVLLGFDRTKWKDRMHLVHNGLEIREFSEQEKGRWKAEIRKELKLPMQSKVILIIGQIAPWKRQEDAIRATQRLLDDGHDIYLCVVGEPKFGQACNEYWHSLHELTTQLGVENRVRFTGFRKDVMEICCAADLLFLCSDNEPFGRVIIEAMSQSLPVVATNAGGVPEIIDHELSGLLYEVGDLEGMLDCADSVLKNDQWRQRMGGNAAERVKDFFSIQNTVYKVESIYKSIMDKPVQELKFSKGKEIS